MSAQLVMAIMNSSAEAQLSERLAKLEARVAKLEADGSSAEATVLREFLTWSSGEEDQP